MVLALLLTAACFSAATAQNAISVHEWGVVIYGDGSTIASGSSGGPWYNPSEVVCFAPVLYFYGPDFTGEVTICSLGEIFNAWPEPDQSSGRYNLLGGLGSAAIWSVSASSDDGIASDNSLSAIPPVSGFDWAMNYWRVPQALLLSRASDSFLDRFLYYEVDLSEVGFPLTLPGLEPEGTPDEYMVTGQILLFRRLDTGVVSVALLEADGLDLYGEDVGPAFGDYSCERVSGILREWADGILTDEEVGAMWSTWEPYVLYGDWDEEYLAVFSLPQPLVDCISILRLTNDAGLPVEYSRFFLGMKAHN
jgi:hypothetical protein